MQFLTIYETFSNLSNLPLDKSRYMDTIIIKFIIKIAGVLFRSNLYVFLHVYGAGY